VGGLGFRQLNNYHKFTELSPFDQNYVRRRLDVARLEKAKSGEVVYPIRTWYSFSGKFSTEARYISSTNKNIQIEKNDGTVIPKPVRQ
jgi:hypothetical protein